MPGGCNDAAVGLDRDLETLRMERIDQIGIDLQQRLAAGQHDEASARACGRPMGSDGRRQRLGRREPAAAGAVGADEIGIAEAADGARPVFLAAAPQVAARKPAEHRRPPGLAALALQRVEDLLDAVGHRRPQPAQPSDAAQASTIAP